MNAKVRHFRADFWVGERAKIAQDGGFSLRDGFHF
jgi:hypothetical protein